MENEDEAKRGKARDVKGAILARTQEDDAPPIWTASDFIDLAKRAQIDTALFRLCEEGALDKVARGIFFVKRHNRLTGNWTVPNPYDILDAVARRDGLKYVVDEMTAANSVGWETAVPARMIVYCSKRISPIRIGNASIQFRYSTGPRMVWAGRPAMRVIQALYYFADRLHSERETIDRGLQSLARREGWDSVSADLRDGFPLVPGWMQEILREHLFNAPEPDIDDEEASPGVRP